MIPNKCSNFSQQFSLKMQEEVRIRREEGHKTAPSGKIQVAVWPVAKLEFIWLLEIRTKIWNEEILGEETIK